MGQGQYSAFIGLKNLGFHVLACTGVVPSQSVAGRRFQVGNASRQSVPGIEIEQMASFVRAYANAPDWS